MENFLKTVACVFITLILLIMLSKEGKTFALLLSIAACVLVILGAVSYLKPLIAFFRRLRSLGQLDNELFDVLLKAVGIGLLAEVTTLICTDSGNAALGKALQILSTTLIVWLSLPLFNELIHLVETILVS